MLNVKCRKCGKRYDDFEFDCCPRCGAYNRAPERETVESSVDRKSSAAKETKKYTQKEYAAFDANLLGLTITCIPVAIYIIIGFFREHAIWDRALCILAAVPFFYLFKTLFRRYYAEKDGREDGARDEGGTRPAAPILRHPRMGIPAFVLFLFVSGYLIRICWIRIGRMSYSTGAVVIVCMAIIAAFCIGAGVYSHKNKLDMEEQMALGRRIGAIASVVVVIVVLITVSRSETIGEKRRQSERSEPTRKEERSGEHSYTTKTVSDDPEPLETFTARDGSVFKLRDWWWENGAIAVKVDVEDAGSGHTVFFEVLCVDADGKPVKLTKYESGQSNGSLVLKFTAGEDGLTPQRLVMKELDKRGTTILSTWQADLEHGAFVQGETKEGETVRLPQVFTAQEASELGLLEWQRTDQGIKLTLYADAESLFPELECVDADGKDVLLKDCKHSDPRTFPPYPVVYRFFMEDENLTPRTFILRGIDKETGEYVVFYQFDLEPEQ